MEEFSQGCWLSLLPSSSMLPSTMESLLRSATESLLSSITTEAQLVPVLSAAPPTLNLFQFLSHWPSPSPFYYLPCLLPSCRLLLPMSSQIPSYQPPLLLLSLVPGCWPPLPMPSRFPSLWSSLQVSCQTSSSRPSLLTSSSLAALLSALVNIQSRYAYVIHLQRVPTHFVNFQSDSTFLSNPQVTIKSDSTHLSCCPVALPSDPACLFRLPVTLPRGPSHLLSVACQSNPTFPVFQSTS